MTHYAGVPNKVWELGPQEAGIRSGMVRRAQANRQSAVEEITESEIWLKENKPDEWAGYQKGITCGELKAEMVKAVSELMIENGYSMPNGITYNGVQPIPEDIMVAIEDKIADPESTKLDPYLMLWKLGQTL